MPVVNIDEVPKHPGLAIAKKLMDQNVLGIKGSGAAIAESERITIIVQTYAPGGRHDPHSHEDKEQAFLVLKGSGRMIINGQPHPIREGSIVYVPPKTEHSTENDSDDELVMALIDVRV